MKNKLAIIGATLVAAAGVFAGFAAGNTPPAPPGQDPCSHGRTGKPCRPDPQPNHGKDCQHHGKKGGVNEDHCKGTTTNNTTTTSTTPGSTTTVTTPGTTTTVPTPGPSTTVTVTTPGPTTTNTVTVPGPTKIITKKVVIIKKIHMKVTSHHKPKTTG